MLVFCDQDNAYPRVEWDFLRETMVQMELHDDFIQMVDIMYKDATLQLKINSQLGEKFQPTNAVAQGSPLSPCLYLLYIQSFVSMLHQSDLEGIEMPGKGGDETATQTIKVLAFADDLVVFLRDESQLPRFKELLEVYEEGAGAVNSWEKTHGMRVGTLRDSTNRLPDCVPRGRCIFASARVGG